MSQLGRMGLVYIGLFIGGLVIGGLIAVVTNPPASPPVAAATLSPRPVSPSPRPSLAGSPSPTGTPLATAPTTEVTDPPATAAPMPQTPVPPTATAILPTLEPSTAAPSPHEADPADIQTFIEDLGRAISRGTNRIMFENLHPAVLDRYGEEACRQYTATSSIPGLAITYLSSEGPDAWDWELDDRTTTIPDAWAVTVDWSQPGQIEEQREVHIAPAGGTWRWFTDCGAPLT